MKKLPLILFCLPMIGFGQFQYKLDSLTMWLDSLNNSFGGFKYFYDSVGKCTTSYTLNNIEKNEFLYDINNNLINTYAYELDVFGNWIIKEHDTLIYNINNQIIETIDTPYYFYYYDINNLPSFKESYSWDNLLNLWSLNGKKEYTYQSGKPILEMYYDYDSGTNTFNLGNKKTEYTYLGNNYVSEEDFELLGTNWVSQEIVTYYYNNIQLNLTMFPYNTPINVAFQAFNLSDITYNLPDSSRRISTGDPSLFIIYHYSAFTSTSIQEHSNNKELLKVTDLLGRETKGKKNEPLFYIYDDGSVEKKIIIE